MIFDAAEVSRIEDLFEGHTHVKHGSNDVSRETRSRRALRAPG